VVTSFSPVKVAYTENMTIAHNQDKTKPRYIKPNLEYGVLKEDDVRTHFYLAREYYYDKEYEKAIKIFDIYIKRAKWLPELAEAYYFKALCLWELKRGNEAREACGLALVINANMKKAHKLMGYMSWEHNRKMWYKFAELADDANVVFP
jgi:tetratricopeptide (TPR) repeat protein